jgi:Dullard-like phosphatase family protein
VLDLLNDSQTFVIEDEIFLPEMSLFQIDQQKKHVIASLQNVHYFDSWKMDDNDYKTKKVYLPKKKSKLVVFDMDETLIHALPPYKALCDKKLTDAADVVLDFEFGDIKKLYVNIRPFMIEWVTAIKQMYQIVVFTASIKSYANTILDFIDPKKQLFAARFYRDSWLTSPDDSFIKDLRIFEDQWNLKDIILVDNSTMSFARQFDNGFPILPFYNDANDTEMVYLYYFLKRIHKDYDLRTSLRSTFWLNKLKKSVIWENIAGVVEYIVEEIGESPEKSKEQVIDAKEPQVDKFSNFFSKNVKNMIPRHTRNRNVKVSGNLSKPEMFHMEPKEGEDYSFDPQNNDSFEFNSDSSDASLEMPKKLSPKIELTSSKQSNNDWDSLEIYENALSTTKMKLNFMNDFSKTECKYYL